MLIPWELLSEDNEEAKEMSARLIEVAAADPLIFDEVMRGLVDQNPRTQIEAAQLVEKITQVRPLFLHPYKRVLIKEIANIDLVKVRQQLAIIYGRALWDEWDMQKVVNLLGQWIEFEQDEHIIINAMQSLHNLAMQKEWIRPVLIKQLATVQQHTNQSVRDIAIKLQS